MSKRHFYESLERENDYQFEYKKLEALCAEKYSFGYGSPQVSINSWIEENFRKWKKRSNYCSFTELRDYLGFSRNNIDFYSKQETSFDLNKYVLFSEMILVLIDELQKYNNSVLNEVINVFTDTVIATIAKAGMEIKRINGTLMIVEQNPVAISVADSVPELSNVIIEYNHYLLRGNIERKKYLLKQIADALEPKKKDLFQVNKGMATDYFNLVNNMNIRHNNCNSDDLKNYNPKFDSLDESEKEKWYDLIYEQGLALFVLLEQRERNKMIDSFKDID